MGMPVRSRLLLLLVAATSTLPVSPRVLAGQSDPRIAKLNALISAYDSLGQISGAVLVAEQGRVLLRRGAGYSDRELSVAARPEHRFLIGSLTKAFTAVLALKQVARGV